MIDDNTSPPPNTFERVDEQIKRVCGDIDRVLATLRDQARQLKERASDER